MLTVAMMEEMFPNRGVRGGGQYTLIGHYPELVRELNRFFQEYGIDTHARVAAFLGTCGAETDYFKTAREYHSGANYEPPGRLARTLGNTQRGDGRRFRGRGLIQTTGRWNYTHLTRIVGRRLGHDYVRSPQMLEEIPVAVESACFFWDDNDLNAYADEATPRNHVPFRRLNGVVNRGNADRTPLHYDKRLECYGIAWDGVPRDFSYAASSRSRRRVGQS